MWKTEAGGDQVLAGNTIDLLSALFLICFGIGLFTSVGALLLGHGHADGMNGHSGVGGHGHSGHGGGNSDFSYNGDANHGHNVGTVRAPVLNLQIVLAFLLGFGAAGLVARQVWPMGLALFHILLGVAGGITFAALVYLLLAKVLVRGQTPYLLAGDFDPVGVEGTVSSGIFGDRLGEISFTMNGSLMAMPAKSREGQDLRKGRLVVVLQVRNNVAIVVPKEDFAAYALFPDRT